MATRNSSGKAPVLKQDALLDHLSTDPSALGPMTVLVGFVGKGSQDGQWRLYLSASLDEYVEFEASDVCHSVPLTPAESSLGGSRLWLRAGSQVQHTKTTSRQIQAEFLSGSIAAAHMASAAASSGARGRALVRCMTLGKACHPDPASIDICRTDPFDNDTINQHIPACRSDGMGHCGGVSLACGTDGGPFCDTGAFVCGFSVGCTHGRECGQFGR